MLFLKSKQWDEMILTYTGFGLVKFPIWNKFKLCILFANSRRAFFTCKQMVLCKTNVGKITCMKQQVLHLKKDKIILPFPSFFKDGGNGKWPVLVLRFIKFRGPQSASHNIHSFTHTFTHRWWQATGLQLQQCDRSQAATGLLTTTSWQGDLSVLSKDTTTER